MVGHPLAVDSAVYSAVYSAVDSAVYSAVRSAVYSAVGSAVDSAVGSAVGSAVDSAVGSAVDSAVRSAVGSAGMSFFAGSLWAGYSAWADYFSEVLAVSIDRNYLEMTESCGFYWTLDSVCFASERPARINLDDRGRLHSSTEQSIGYPSGWGLWHWHGVAVPEWIILQPERISLELINKESNAEVRRAMVERYGLDRLKDHGKLIHSDSLKGMFPQYINTGGSERQFLGYVAGEEKVSLYELPVENAEGRKAKVIHVTCPSTLRDYVLGVDADHTRAIAAVASTFNLTEQQYREAVCAHS
jgi:hypothetical protein